MSSTENQKQASRENGSLGGVKTEDGKAISRLNSTKHGVLARLETKYDLVSFDEVYANFEAEFGATTPSRKVMIELLTLTYLRILRCARFERDKIAEMLNPPEYRIENGPYDLDLGGKRILVSKNDQAPLESSIFSDLESVCLRYEPQLLKRYLRLIEQLTFKA